MWQSSVHFWCDGFQLLWSSSWWKKCNISFIWDLTISPIVKLFSGLYYFLVVNHQWKVNNRYVTVRTGMSRHLSNGFSSTVANWSAYFIKLTANIPYINYANTTKKGTHLKVRTLFDMCDLWQNGLFQVAIGVNQTVESRCLRLQVVNLWIQLSDSSIQAGFLKKNISEGERGVRNTWIPQVRWGGLKFNNAPLYEAV